MLLAAHGSAEELNRPKQFQKEIPTHSVDPNPISTTANRLYPRTQKEAFKAHPLSSLSFVYLVESSFLYRLENTKAK